MALQPTHRLDHPMVYVSPSDTAWNYALINLERELIDGRTPEPGMVLTVGVVELRDGASPDTRSPDDFMIRMEGHEPVPFALPWKTRQEHPFTQYLLGESRFDISTVRPYLLQEETPAEFALQRATARAWGSVVDPIQAGKLYLGKYHAIALTLVSITGIELERLRDKKGVLRLRSPKASPASPIADEVLDEIRLEIGDEEWRQLGDACLAANMPLTRREKKP